LLKIADFGFVKEITNLTDSVSRSKLKQLIKDKELLRTSTLCGTPEYIPPNVIEAQTQSASSFISCFTAKGPSLELTKSNFTKP